MTAEGPVHKQLVETRFDQGVQRWDDIYSNVTKVNDLIQIQRKDFALGFLRAYAKPGGEVLDVGCGTGVVSIAAVRAGFAVHGIDISEKMVERSKENLARSGLKEAKCSFEYNDLMRCRFDERTFDAVLALGLIEYQDDELDTLREIKRVLRPGGVLIISGPQKYTIANGLRIGIALSRIYLALKRLVGIKVEEEVEISINEYTLARFSILLRKAGFKVVDSKRHGYANFMFLGRLLGFKGELFLFRVFGGLSKVLPIDRWANNIIVVGTAIDGHS
jgi:2-polyprenyl-3-methyl-5-hydroxy-6-metoxy-1,4-benzoquinol methylase